MNHALKVVLALVLVAIVVILILLAAGVFAPETKIKSAKDAKGAASNISSDVAEVSAVLEEIDGELG